VSLPQLTSAAFSPALNAAPTLETIYGRAFGTTRVYDAPSIASKIGSRLWANTVTPILDAAGDWYHVAEGYVLRRNMQPMIAPLQPAETTFTPPFWAEVSGAIATVYRSCAVDFYPRLRVGHGGILRVIDWLPGDGMDWYGVTDSENGDLVGWTQASVWSLVNVETAAPSLTLVADKQSCQLTVYDGACALLTAPFSTTPYLAPGVYSISERSVSRWAYSHRGAPWSLTFGDDLRLTGVYWHNQFGNRAPGVSLQVTPPLARWLYPRAAEVIIS
ncbi:MAG: hypothetical protein ABI700_19065, partial [Chloroflexota bacterium]